MRIQRRIVTAAVLALFTTIHHADAQHGRPTAVASPPSAPQLALPRLEIVPSHPSDGSLVRLVVDRFHGADDSIVAIHGTFADEPLHFVADGPTRLESLGAVPVDVSDSVAARVYVERQSGAVDTLHLSLRYPHHPPPAPAATNRSRPRLPAARRLRVDAKFTRPMDDATETRVEHENELAREVGRHAQDTPKLWTLPFLRPRASRVTSRFGTGRVFNGRLASSHLGIDYRGALGDPIYAANRGVVALVGSFFLAGNVVYINHGDGVMTGYFHMTRQEVAVGDTVERGQEIGLVGATGRVTGPHLHWSARYGALTIDPGDLLALGPPFVSEEGRSAESAASTTKHGGKTGDPKKGAAR